MPYRPPLCGIFLGAYFLRIWGWGWSELFSEKRTFVHIWTRKKNIFYKIHHCIWVIEAVLPTDSWSGSWDTPATDQTVYANSCQQWEALSLDGLRLFLFTGECEKKRPLPWPRSLHKRFSTHMVMVLWKIAPEEKESDDHDQGFLSKSLLHIWSWLFEKLVQNDSPCGGSICKKQNYNTIVFVDLFGVHGSTQGSTQVTIIGRWGDPKNSTKSSTTEPSDSVTPKKVSALLSRTNASEIFPGVFFSLHNVLASCDSVAWRSHPAYDHST